MPRPGLDELVAPGRCALLLQEVQRGVMGNESVLPALAEAARRGSVVDHIRQLVVVARQVGVPVIHCTAENLPGGFGTNRNARLLAGARRAGADNLPGTTAVQPLPEVGPEPADHVLPRYHGLSPLAGTQLDALLRNEGVSALVVVGVSLNVAIPNLVFDAVNRSYQVVLVTDAVAGVPEGYGQQMIDNTLSLVATLTTTPELLAAWHQAAGGR